MNKILTKVTALCVGLAMVAGVGVAVGSKAVSEAKAADGITNTITFGGGESIGSYTSSFTETDSANTSWTIAAFNNNQWKWSSSVSGANKTIKCGRKNVASVGSIYNTSKLSSTTFTKVDLYISALTSGKLNSIKVYGGSSSGTSGTVLATVTSVTTSTSNPTSITLANQSAYAFYTIAFDMASGSGNGLLSLDKVCWYQNTTPAGTPSISVDKGSLEFLSNGSAQIVTVTATDFSSTPTISIEGSTSYVNCSVSGLTISVSPKAVGSETVTVKAVNNTEQASATFTVNVLDKHGRVSDDPFSVAEVISLIDEDTSKTHSNIYVEGIVSQVDSYNSTYKSITYWVSDDGTTSNQFECYSGKGIASADFSSVNDIEVGASVVVCGTAKYYGSTHEFDKNNYLVSYTAPTSSPLSSISLSGTHATSFDVGDTFSYAGLVVTAHYEDSTSKEVTPTSVSTPDMTTAGQKTVTVSYTENEVTKSENYSITVNAVTLYTMSFDPGSGTGTMESVQVKEGADYTLPACTFIAPAGMTFDAWTYIGTRMTQVTDVHSDYEFTALWKEVSEVTDTLNNGNTIKNTETTYSSWTTETMDSGAVYSGQSAGGNTSIQLRSNNSNSGVVSSTSGGNLISVTITFNTNTAATRTVQVYGKTSSYSDPTELYNDSTKGTLLGEANIDSGASQTIEVDGNYQYVGIRSKSGALYIDEIKVVWEAAPVTPKVLTEISVENPQTEYEVGDAFVYPKVVAHYDDESSKYVTTATFTNDSTAVAGNFVVGVSYSENSITRETSYNITVSEPAPVETKTYKKVKTNLANFAGDYLIVYEEGSVAFDGSLENPDVASNTFAVSITDEAISASEAYEFTVAKKEGGYSLKSASGLYIGKTADSNGMDKNASDNYTNTISYSGTEESDMDIVGSGKPHLRYNASSGQERFRFFKSESYTGQKAVSLYIEVANDAEAFALDILNLTTEVCSAEGEHAAGDFATAWSTLTTKYNSVVNKDLLVGGDADATGTFFAEALARYDILVAKYGLNPFMTGRVSNFSYLPHYESNLDSSSSITIIVIVAVTSMTILGVTLVLRKRKHQ